MLLFYVRHGKPTPDDGLTPLGMRQAEAVGKRIAAHGIDRIYSSPTTRAQLTAQPLSEISLKPVTVLDWCDEVHFSEPLDRGTAPRSDLWKSGIMHSREMYDLADRWYEHPVFEGTDTKEYILTTQKKLDELTASWGYIHDREKGTYRVEHPNSERIALFAHAGFSTVFTSLLLDIPYPMLHNFCTAHSSMITIHFPESGDAVRPGLFQWGNDSHLYREGLPTAFNSSGVPV